MSRPETRIADNIIWSDSMNVRLFLDLG